MTVIMYGSHLCPDTLYALNKLKDGNVDVDFRNISAALGNLKEFIKIRETDAMYDEVKKNNGLGIPLMIKENGEKTFDYQDILNHKG